MSGRVVHVADQVEGVRYIGRASPRRGLAGSPLANPFRIGRDGDRLEVVASYDQWLWRLLTGSAVDPHHPEASFWAEQVIACRDQPLTCWCRHDGEAGTAENMCHGDILIELLNTYTDDELRALARGEAP